MTFRFYICRRQGPTGGTFGNIALVPYSRSGDIKAISFLVREVTLQRDTSHRTVGRMILAIFANMYNIRVLLNLLDFEVLPDYFGSTPVPHVLWFRFTF
jgi:hypothetical protein